MGVHDSNRVLLGPPQLYHGNPAVVTDELDPRIARLIGPHVRPRKVRCGCYFQETRLVSADCKKFGHQIKDEIYERYANDTTTWVQLRLF